MNKFFLGLGIIIVITAVVLIVFSQHSVSNNSSNADITWQTNLDSALQEAKSTNKSIFIDFYGEGCSYCKQLSENTLSDSSVEKKLNQDYVAVKIDTDQDPNLSSQYKIYELPTLVILNPNGHEIKRQEGYVSADQLLNWL